MNKQAHIYIKGDVVGVGFRAWAKIQAKIVGVNGWIKNIYDEPERYGSGGGIEVLIQGIEEKITRYIELIKVGPPISHVQECEIMYENVTNIYETFEIRK